MMKTILPSRLTERQKDIGDCLLRGMSLNEIADKFNISRRMVKIHQKLIQEKLFCLNAYQVGYQLGCFLSEERKILKYYLEKNAF